MLKKHGFAVLIIFMVLQLCVPAGMISSVFISDSYTEKHGTEYKFKVISFHADEKGWLYCNLAANGLYSFRNETYSVISEGPDGYAVIQKTNEKPETTSYIKNKTVGFSIPEKCLYVGDSVIPEQVTEPQTDEEYDFETEYTYPDAYILTYVYKGRIYVKNMYIGDVPIDEFFS